MLSLVGEKLVELQLLWLEFVHNPRYTVGVCLTCEFHSSVCHRGTKVENCCHREIIKKCFKKFQIKEL